MKVFKQCKSSDYNNLLQFFGDTNDNYNPSLSDRECGIEGFIDKWREKDGIAVICEENDKIIGSIGYWHEDDSVHFNWIGVDNPKRSFVPIRLIQKMFQEDTSLVNKRGYARTWLNNKKSQRFMERLGGKRITDEDLIHKLEQIQGPLKRKSIWYEFDYKESYQKLKRILN